MRCEHVNKIRIEAAYACLWYEQAHRAVQSAPPTLYLQVIGGMIRVVEPYDTYNTLIEASLDVVLRELKAVLDGDETAFSHAWAGGRARIVGLRSIRDGMAFREGFRRLAWALRHYKGAA